MKFKHIYAWTPYQEKQVLSISDAIEAAHEPDREGAAERAFEYARNVSRTVATLIEMMHDKGVLGDEDVLKFINTHTYERVEEGAS